MARASTRRSTPPVAPRAVGRVNPITFLQETVSELRKAVWPSKEETTRLTVIVIVLAVAVVAHWFMDALVHLPDLPLAGNDSLKVGLGLWDNVGATYVLEFGLLAAGAWIYVTTKTKRHPLRTARLAILIGLLLAFSVVNLWAPPPNNMTLIGASAIVMYLGIAWLGSWVDRDPPPDPDSETHHRKRKPKAAR